jgi:hypothetical protein
LETTANRGIDLVLNGECLTRVLGVSLERAEHFALLSCVKLLGRDNGNLLFLIELLVQFLVLARNLLDADEAFVFSQDD